MFKISTTYPRANDVTNDCGGWATVDPMKYENEFLVYCVVVDKLSIDLIHKT